MRYWLLLMLGSLGLLTNGTHDVPMASFTLAMDTAPWKVTIEVDREDLIQVLNEQEPELSATVAYIQAHTSWTVDGESAQLDLCTFVLDGHHCRLQGELQLATSSPSQLEIENTCFFEVQAEQANIIYLDKGGESRGFRLHRGRPETIIDLTK